MTSVTTGKLTDGDSNVGVIVHVRGCVVGVVW